MQLANCEERGISILEQMRAIEGELFLLSGTFGALDLKNHQRLEHLRGKRTQLAGELLLIDLC